MERLAFISLAVMIFSGIFMTAYLFLDMLNRYFVVETHIIGFICGAFYFVSLCVLLIVLRIWAGKIDKGSVNND